MALLVASPAEDAQAVGSTVTLSAPLTIAANGTQTITIFDANIVAGTSFIIATIDPASAGTAQFASGGGQALVCIDTPGTGCDTSGAATTIAIGVTGTGGLGAVVVNIRLVDGVDGILGPPEVNDAGILSLAYTQVLPASGVVVTTALPNLISGLVGGAPALITVSVTDSGGTFIPGITVFASSSIGDFASDGAGVTALCDLSLPGVPTPGSDATCSYASIAAASTLELHPDSVYGVAVVTISVPALGFVNTQTVSFYDIPADVTVAVTALSLTRISNAGGATSVTLSVTDANGIPVPFVSPRLRVDPAVTVSPLVLATTFCVSGGPGAGAGTCAIGVTESGATATPEGFQTLQASLPGPAAFATTDAVDIELVGPIAAIAFVSQTPTGTIPNLGTVAVAFHCTTAGGVDCLAGAGLGIGVTGAGIVALPVGAEPPRECWRLQSLRGWSDDTTRQIPSGDPRAGGPDGVRARAGPLVAVGNDQLDRLEVRDDAGDVTEVGATG